MSRSFSIFLRPRFSGRPTWKAVLLISAAFGLFWSYQVLSHARERSAVGGMSAAILAGERVPDVAASRVLQYLQQRAVPGCNRLLEDRAVIQLYVAAGEQSRGETSAADQLDKARAEIRRALSCAPSNAYLWYGLYWTERALNTRQQDALRFLEFSYEMAPREGWLAYYRSSDAVANVDSLSPATRRLVKAEYLSAVREAPALAVIIFKDADHGSRIRLLQWISDAPLSERQHIATLFDAADLVEDVPGVEYQGGHVAQTGR
jgi:tetratricopeptide (TPR) repeat protein